MDVVINCISKNDNNLDNKKLKDVHGIGLSTKFDGKEFVVMLKDDKTVSVVINNFVYNFKTDGAKITIENFKQGK
ncbi:MAG TPA: hypothetical protein VI790_05500 [Candidatus Nanoarchaeia archaeon]|nr:hypothetical protein [Candidatus Nanoarchaeia archaeon]